MSGGARQVLSSPDLVTSPGAKATFLVGGEIPVVTSTGLGAINVQYQPYGVQLNVTPNVLGNGSVDAIIAPEVSALDYANAVIVSGFTIPALDGEPALDRRDHAAGRKHPYGRPRAADRDEDDLQDSASLGDSDPWEVVYVDHLPNQQSDVVFVMTPEILSRQT